jgi:hypothetical protein
LFATNFSTSERSLKEEMLKLGFWLLFALVSQFLVTSSKNKEIANLKPLAAFGTQNVEH